MRVVKLVGMKFHPRAECIHCDWRRSQGAYTRKDATDHVRATGHSVDVIVEDVARYGKED